ncbi:hypothetical protein [Variovorax sp. dw_954]|uniref:hypothetical protein n=1 Tax=Variovorax sp. dw_954 TaxID=2720078 RepID=UPI001BD230C8|nr:hypothetical protein [Variovorax sp. dw_954]
MSYQDMNNGRLGVGGNKSSIDYQEGVAARDRQREQAQRETAHASRPYSSGTTDTYRPGTWHAPGASAGGGPTLVQPETLATSAKSGAGLFAVLCVGYMLLQGGWTLGSLAVYAGVGAVAGALAGAALYIALKVLAVAAKVAGALLVIGIVLHWLGVINLWPMLAKARHLLGL